MSRSATSNPIDLFNLSNKTAVVTGGAGILGKQFCKTLSAYGANVALVDLDQDLATKEAASIGQNVVGFACDVSNPTEVNNLVRNVVKEFDTIQILINNAATKSDNLEDFFAPFEDYSLREWRRIMSVNLDGMFLAAQAFGKQMIKQKLGGSVIQTSSIYGAVAPDQRIYEGSEYMGYKINTPAVYSASKAGVLGLTKYLASYWADHKIRVNAISPGGVSSGQNEEFKLKYSRRVPLGRMADSMDMVGAVLYLASDASSYVTGQNLIVDGGLTCW